MSTAIRISPNNLFKSQILTPRGNPLRFKRTHERGNAEHFGRTGISPGQTQGAQKGEWLLGLWNSFDGYAVICGDFDYQNTEKGLPSSEVERLLIEHVKVPFLLSHSISGNVKAFFLVKAAWMRRHRAAKWLEEVIPQELHFCMDRNSGTELCFFNEKMFQQLAHWLPSAEVAHTFTDVAVAELTASSESGLKLVKTPAKPRQFQYKLYDKTLPTWAQDYVTHGKSGTADLREGLMRMLLVAWNLCEKWDLPTTKLAEQLGCAPAQVSVMLKDLVRLGWLKVEDASYIVGKKAKSYSAQAELLNFIDDHRDSVLSGSTYVKPQVVQAGGFWLQSMGLLAHFRGQGKLDEFMDWVAGMEGITDKRLAEAQKYYMYERQRHAA